MKEQIQKNNSKADSARRAQENKLAEKQQQVLKAGQQPGTGKEKKEEDSGKTKDKKTETKNPVKQKGTVYLYRITEHTENNYAFEDNQASNAYLTKVIAPEVLRILNNNWLAIEFDVKVISQAEAKKKDSIFLFNTNSTILGITRRRDDSNFKLGNDRFYSKYGASTISEANGLTDTDPDHTYINLIEVNGDSKKFGVSSDYFLAYTIAHECLHQLHYAALSKLNMPTDRDHQKFHTAGWTNLNKDGDGFGATDFNTPMPGSTGLKNKAEWIPISIKKVINNAAATSEKH